MDYQTWESMIVNRMNQPAPVTVHIRGEYQPSNHSGFVSATFRNDSTAQINGRVLMVITEDSLFYPAPNGVVWHSNVPRDYLPDHNGTLVTIPPGDSITVSQSFTTNPAWNDAHLKFKTWIQNDVMLPDSTKEIWQGAMVNLLELAIKEENGVKIGNPDVSVIPNPAPNQVYFIINNTDTEDLLLEIYDIAGQRIKTINRIGPCITWDRRYDNGRSVKAGVYLYRIKSGKMVKTGKVVLL